MIPHITSAWGQVCSAWGHIRDAVNKPVTTPPDPETSSDLSSPEVLDLPSTDLKEPQKDGLSKEFALLREETRSLCEKRAELCEKRAEKAFSKLKLIHTQNQTMIKLQQLITSQSEKDGTFIAKDDQAKRLFSEAREYDKTVVPEKTSFTKDERNALIKAIDLKSSNLDTDIKVLINEAQENLQIRNTLKQER